MGSERSTISTNGDRLASLLSVYFEVFAFESGTERIGIPERSRATKSMLLCICVCAHVLTSTMFPFRGRRMTVGKQAGVNATKPWTVSHVDDHMIHDRERNRHDKRFAWFN